MPTFNIRLLETPEDIRLVEELQRVVWPGSETEIVPAHMLITAVHNGGLVLGAFDGDQLVGFVFGFPGFEMVPDGPRLKHCSHMLGVHPDYRDFGLGFRLKRAQWQMARKQGIDHITWTYDPLLSRNAHLNIARLGAVCNTYRRSEYGELRDGLNAGLPTDRFQVDWWLNTARVQRRLGQDARPVLRLDSFLDAGIKPIVWVEPDASGWPRPPRHWNRPEDRLVLAEIPTDFHALKSADMELARAWRFFSREVFETCFAAGYIVTDFVHDQGHSFYVLTYGESTLD